MLKIKKLLFKIYVFFFKPNEMESNFLRSFFEDLYGINVGKYSYGCFDQTRFQSGLKIGRYCSFSRTCRRVNANHGINFLMLHPYAYNPSLGTVNEDKVIRTECVIEDDVWVGHNVVILPSVTFVGRGSILAAGAIVTKNVERYSIVAGVPAKKVGSRFTEEEIKRIENSRWWDLTKNEIEGLIKNSPEVVYEPLKYLKGKLSK